MNSIENLMSETLSKIKSIVDITTIVGSPITMDKTVIIPISKATIGLVVGGGEINNNQKGNYPFSGGTGTGVNLTPYGFLIYSNNKWEYCNAGTNANYSELIKLAGNIIKNLKGEQGND